MSVSDGLSIRTLAGALDFGIGSNGWLPERQACGIRNWLQRIAAAHIVHEAVLEHRYSLK